jgi:hypothetical protein
MAKGQKRSGREPKKPKRDKPKAKAAASPFAALHAKPLARPPEEKKQGTHPIRGCRLPLGRRTPAREPLLSSRRVVMAWVVDCEYVVEQDECHWTVSNQGRHFGHFVDRRDAMRSAVADAARVRRLGHHATVLVRRADGRLRAVPAQVGFRA